MMKMRTNFIYNKDVKKREKKYYNYFYSIHKNIQNDMKQLFMELSKRCNSLTVNENNIYSDKITLHLDQTVMIVEDILKAYFPLKYYRCFKEMKQSDQIKFYDSESIYLCEQYDHGVGNCSYSDMDERNNYIYICLTNEIYDLFAMIHEVSHFMHGGYKDLISKEFLSELSPIFSEFIVLDALLKYDTITYSVLGHMCDRYLEITETVEYLLQKQEYIDTFDFFDRFKYLLCLLLASHLFYEYQLNPESISIKLEKFERNLGVAHFNHLLQNLGIHVKYYDGEIHVSKETIRQLLNSFEWSIDYLNQQYQQVEKKQQKLKMISKK